MSDTIDTQRIMRFVSHFPTHSTVWELMEFFADGNVYLERLMATGEVFRDASGTYWWASCSFFTTRKRAEDYAGKPDHSAWTAIEIITL